MISAHDFRHAELHDPRVVHANTHAAVVISRKGSRACLALAYRDTYSVHRCARLYTASEAAIKRLVPLYVEVADLLDQWVAASDMHTLADGASNYKLVVTANGRGVLRIWEQVWVPFRAQMVMRHARAKLEKMLEKSPEVHDRFEALIAAASEAGRDTARRRLLSRLLDESPELSVEDVLARVDRQLPLLSERV